MIFEEKRPGRLGRFIGGVLSLSLATAPLAVTLDPHDTLAATSVALANDPALVSAVRAQDEDVPPDWPPDGARSPAAVCAWWRTHGTGDEPVPRTCRVVCRADDARTPAVVVRRATGFHEGLAVAVRERGRWRVVHKLNQCGSASASVYRQGLGEFFLDDLHDYEAGVVVLGTEAQAKLLPLLKDDRRLLQVHEPAYNMLAYPWS